VALEAREQLLLERKAELLEVRGMLRLGIHADRPPELASELLRELDHLVEGRDLELSVELVRSEGQAPRGAALDFRRA
jgi:hypothetical protein